MSSIRRILIFLTLLIAALPTLGQDQDPALARELMAVVEEILSGTAALDQARESAVMAANSDTTFTKANFYAGELIMRTINRQESVPYFQRVLRQDPDYRFDIEFWIARGYQFGLEFDKAIEYFNRYKSRLTKKPNYQGKDRQSPLSVDRHIQECVNAKNLVADPKPFSIVNIGREINSDQEDYAPVLNEAEDELVFTSRRADENLNQNVYIDNKYYEDIYIAYKKNGKWDYAKNIGAPVNTPDHGSSLALSADGNTLFIYKDEGAGDIYVCQRLPDGKFSEPEPLPGIINSTFAEKSVTISKDQKTLYFSSNRPGGYGDMDIYVATKDSKGHWSNVKNLGPTINTEYEEDGPFIDYDGVTLYFSSKGHDSMGGHDIFKSKYDPKAKQWSTPENMGFPINTPDDDIYIIVSSDGLRAYYSSVRDDGMGYTDIYMVTSSQSIKDPEATPVKPVTQPVVTKTPDPVLPKKDTTKTEPIKPPVKQPVVEPKKEIKPLIYVVKVVDRGSKTPLDAKLKLQGSKDNILVGSTSQGNGVYEFRITNTTPKDYKLSIESDGYVFQNQNLRIEGATTESKTVNRTIELQKISIGVTSILRNIYYDYDKASFKTESYPELNKLEAMLRQNQNVRVEIGGHTDAYGKWDYNKYLSQKRAEAVKDYLLKKGIDARRIKAVGYGESKPIASNDDESEGRALNRRVEFKVLQN
jgi:outer membrane protein OmpA-like peptidoglycan-associated protein/cell division septation protein DedD